MSQPTKQKNMVKATYGHKGHKHSQATKDAIALIKKGSKHTLETRLKMSLSAKRGAENRHWQGGITAPNKAVRNSQEYRLWREAVFERDNWTCVWCGVRGAKLNADHIKPFALFPELRLAIDNGRTLCEPCHATTDTFRGRLQTYKKHN